MEWLFAAVILLVVVYLAVQFPGVRKAIWICFALLALGAVSVAVLIYYQQAENERRAELSRRLIKIDEIVIGNASLLQSYGSWKLSGNVTNRSRHELSGLTLNVKMEDCPEPGRCVIIGEDKDASTYSLSVPPNQMRAFDLYVTLHNLPSSKNMEWSYTVKGVRGNAK